MKPIASGPVCPRLPRFEVIGEEPVHRFAFFSYVALCRNPKLHRWHWFPGRWNYMGRKKYNHETIMCISSIMC